MGNVAVSKTANRGSSPCLPAMNITEFYEYDRRRRRRSEWIGAAKVLALAVILAATVVVAAKADRPCPPGTASVSVDSCAPTGTIVMDNATLISVP